MSKFRLGKAHGSDYWYVYWTESGKTKRKATRTKHEQTAKQFLADLEAGLNEPPSYITVSLILDSYLDYKGKEYKLKNLPTSYKESLEYAVKSFREKYGDLRIDQISQSTGREYISLRKEANKSNSTIAKELSIVNAAVNFAIKEGWDIKYKALRLPPRAAPRDKWLSPNEAKNFLDSIETLHVMVFAYLGFYTLARKGAILDLTWDRVDLKRGLIDYNNPNRSLSNKRRSAVPMGKQLKAVLQEARKAAQTDYVIEYNGKPVGNIKKAFAKAAKDAGIYVTAHMLRHTGATLMAQRGVDPFTIAGMAGDSVKTIMANYAKHHPDYLKKGVRALEKLYG